MMVQGNQSFPFQQQESARAQIGRGFVCEVDPVGLRRRRRIERPRPRRCDRLLHARPRERRGRLRPGNYRVDRTRSAFYLPNTRNFPKNTEVDMTLTFVNEQTVAAAVAAAAVRCRVPRRSAPLAAAVVVAASAAACSPAASPASRRPPDAVTMREHASFVELPDGNYAAAHRRSARRLRRPVVRRLQRADRRADAVPLPAPSSPAEEGSERGDQRAGQADSVLGGFRRAGRRQEGAASKARRGGTRRSKPRASATRSRSTCCPTAPIRWTSATT